MEKFGIYIHVPFCRRKCIYCDFYSVGERMVNPIEYGNAVVREFKRFEIHGDAIAGVDMVGGIPKDAVVSLYIGGGTPSLLPGEVIAQWREMIKNEVGEFTIEVNPDDVTREKAEEWRRAGVNRISMGVQSLVDSELKLIGRRHTADRAIEAFKILREYFDNISLDLMFGLPGQTLGSLEKTVDAFVSLHPEHISAYSLMYEERTALTRLRDAGKISESDEGESVEMFRLITGKLREGGYDRYEISNYSLPGYRSHHNSNYWKGLPYLGLGPGAHSYDGKNIRRWNGADIRKYMEIYGKEEIEETPSNYIEIEELAANELREEMILTRLRTSEGLLLEEYETRFGREEREKLMRLSRKFRENGELILSDSGNLVLTEKGVMVSDEVISELF